MKSVPIDDRDVIVFAIRGTTHSFTDWAVNVKTKPTSPEGFLVRQISLGNSVNR